MQQVLDLGIEVLYFDLAVLVVARGNYDRVVVLLEQSLQLRLLPLDRYLVDSNHQKIPLVEIVTCAQCES